MTRIETIKQLRQEGKTYQQVADAIGVTRQRVHQIYSYGEKHNQRNPLVERKCGNPKCVNVMSFRDTLTNKKKQYCSRACLLEVVKLPREEKLRRLAAKANRYYHTYKDEPWMKDQVKRHNHKYHDSPLGRAAMKRAYAKMKADPVRWSRYLERSRESWRRRRMQAGQVMV